MTDKPRYFGEASRGQDECVHADRDWPMRRCRECGARLYETTAGVIRTERRSDAPQSQPGQSFDEWLATVTPDDVHRALAFHSDLDTFAVHMLIGWSAARASSDAPQDQDVSRTSPGARHPSTYILEEMFQRNLRLKHVAFSMGGNTAVNLLALEMYILCAPDDGCLLGEAMAQGLAEAFGTSAEFWMNLERLWLDRRANAVDITGPEGGNKETEALRDTLTELLRLYDGEYRNLRACATGGELSPTGREKRAAWERAREVLSIGSPVREQRQD